VSDEYGLLFDHVHLRVRDLGASRTFYEAAVGALGLTTTWADDHAVEIRELVLSDDAPPSGPIHLAFRAGKREAVDRFYAAALRAGGRDNGPPGERGYHPGYYSAYVLDPGDNNVEAVFHGRLGAPAIPSEQVGPQAAEGRSPRLRERS
jgi:catechol 2,3-dioxygenase-like lactoylglutathione lyase family enzyme